MAHVINTGSFGHTLTARAGKLIEGLKAARSLRGEYNRTVSELNSLSDRELLDLGISRYDIREIAHRHVYGD